MSLQYIREAEVVCEDLQASVDFHCRTFGFEVREQTDAQALLGAPGAPSGQLRLVQGAAGLTQDPPKMWDRGPRLLGMYSRELEETARLLRENGGKSGPLASYGYGDRTMTEIAGYGRDGVYWTVPWARPGLHRPSAAYEADVERVHSELHTAVLLVTEEEHADVVAFFQAGGLGVVFNGSLVGEEIEKLCDLPAGGGLHIAFMSGPEHLPARLEIMSVLNVPGDDRSSDPIGLRRLRYVCDDVEQTRAVLVAAGAEPLQDGALLGPVGVEIELVPELP